MDTVQENSGLAVILLAAFEAIPEGFVIYGPDDRLVACNAAYRRLYSLSSSAMKPGTPFETILRHGLENGQYPAAGETAREHEAWLKERLAAHRRADTDIEQRLDDDRWLQIRERRLETGHVIGFRSDITAIKRLGIAHDRLSRTVERSAQEIYLLDPATARYIDVNRGASLNLGYAREELLGRSPDFITPDFDEAAVFDIVAPLIDGTLPVLEFETLHRRRDGTTYPCRIRAFHDREDPDSAGVIVAFGQDISESRRLERELAQGRADLEILLQGIPDLIVRAKPDTTLTFVNTRFAESRGIPSTALVGRRLIDLMTGQQRREVEEKLSALTPDLPVLSAMEQVVDRTGTERSYQWSHTMRFDGETADSLFSVGRDVTELYAVNEALAKANINLESFAYAASHDLRSPIQTMRSLLGVLEEDYLKDAPEDARIVFDRLKGVSDRMLQLSNGVLDYARVSGKPPEVVVFDSGEMIDGVLGNLEAEIAESGARVTVEGKMPVLTAGRPQIAQVFQNVVSNALKFCRPGEAPEIEIGSATRGTFHVFSVKDRGIGIDEESREDIFKPFNRLHGRRAYSGSGLGLTICRRIVEAHGGRIRAANRKGGGTWIEFSIKDQTDG